MTDTLQKIKDNTLTDLELSVSADEAFDDVKEFFSALGENKSIETVKLTGDFIGDLRHDARHELLTSLGKITTLKEAYLGDGLVMLTDIQKMVTGAKNLRTFTMDNLVLQGVSDHFDAFEATLYAHPSIKEFEMIECTPASQDCSLEQLDRAGKKFSSPTSINNPALKSQSAVSA